MKRAITTSVVAGMLGTLGFAPVVSADGLYGSVRSGVYMVSPEGDGDTTWDVGAYDGHQDHESSDKLWSRIGVKASHELDGGMTAGLHLEKRLDNFRTRHQNVYLSGGFGTLTIGQQGSTYDDATNVDGAYFLGGNLNPSGRQNGIRYQTNLGGPFDFDFMIRDNNMDENSGYTKKYALVEDTNKNGKMDKGEMLSNTAQPLTAFSTVMQVDDKTMMKNDTGQGEGIDILEASGKLSIGPVTVTAGMLDGGDGGDDHAGGTIGGSFGALGWELGVSTVDANDGMDSDRFALFASYGLGDGTLYGEFESQETDMGTMPDMETEHVIMGYAHTVAPGVLVIGEYLTTDTSNKSGSDKAVLALRVDF